MNTYYSNGKLLLTGEYLVLDGALSLAMPTTFGQSLIVEPTDNSMLIWKSLDHEGKVWFENEFSFEQIATSLTPRNDNPILERLIQILKAAKQLDPQFLNTYEGFKITTKLDFPRDWGLGTSSTLINNFANWANVDPYKLLNLTFGGSGYDIACAQHNHPISYQVQDINNRQIKSVAFNPKFKDCLYFVHLNKKQNSRDGIAQYKAIKHNLTSEISEISAVTSNIISCESLQDFNNLMEAHENIIGSIIKQTPIKNSLFNDFKGSIKSLGAWGGDFVLVTSNENPKAYFENKGFNTIIPYNKMILK